jgi:hypothetical protein
MSKLLAFFGWVKKLGSEDDQGTVPSSTRWIAMVLAFLTASLVITTEYYVLWRNANGPVVGGLAACITALGFGTGYVQGKRN